VFPPMCSSYTRLRPAQWHQGRGTRNKEVGKESVDLLGGLQVVELAEEVSGKVDINELWGLEVQTRQAENKARSVWREGGISARRG
jgi:hypothetical protein